MKRLLLIVLLLLPLNALAAPVDFLADGTLTSGAENRIPIKTEAAGFLSLAVSSADGTVLAAWDEWVEEGDNLILWDGLGHHGEVFSEGAYAITGTLTTYELSELSGDGTLTFGKPAPMLTFALPTGDTLYREDGWACEVGLTRAGSTVRMAIFRTAEDRAPLDTLEKKYKADGPQSFPWDGKAAGKPLSPGTYLLRFSLKEDPARTFDVPVTIAEGHAPAMKVAVTGPVLPEGGMSDGEIWALMQQPAVVADVKATATLSMQEGKGKGTEVAVIAGQSQAVEVLRIEDKYALVGAYSQKNGEYAEGWVRLSDLKAVAPASRYGLLIDKAAQTLTVYETGKPIATLPVSTGLPIEERRKYETPAGSYLTLDHVGGYEKEGFRYPYGIRLAGERFLQAVGHSVSGAGPDLGVQTALLGAAVTEGGIRLPRGNEAGVNAWWLCTHLPQGTRVLILDDPEQRALRSAAAGEAVTLSHAAPETPPALRDGEFELTLTVGGDAVIGTREAWWDRPDAFPAALAAHGLAYPFSGLASVFGSDDMTLVNLEGVLKADAQGENKTKEYRFRGLPEWAQIMNVSSIEQVSIANNHYIDYGMEGRDATRQALEAANVPYSGFDHVYIWETQGVKIGFGGCREAVWLKDPTVIARDVNALRRAGCDLILYTCHWGTEYAPNRNATQERMAAAATAAGADIVLGGHPHVVQGVDTVQDTLVLYSLGNLMFGGTIDMTTFDGMLAQLRLRFGEDGYVGCTLSLIPVLTSGRAAEGVNDFRPVVAQGEDKARILQKVQDDTGFPLLDDMWFAAR